MVSTDPNLHFDYGNLVNANLRTLLNELAEVHSAISNLIIRVGFLKQEEIRNHDSHVKEMRIEMEALRDAYVEKKWLLVKLIEYGPHGVE